MESRHPARRVNIALSDLRPAALLAKRNHSPIEPAFELTGLLAGACGNGLGFAGGRCAVAEWTGLLSKTPAMRDLLVLEAGMTCPLGPLLGPVSLSR